MSQQVLTFAGSPLSGAAMISALESKLQSLASNRSGTSRPSDIVAGEIWLDTTTETAQLLKFWDGTDDIKIATINATTNAITFTGTATSGANSNITSLSGLTTPLSVAQGGTGGTTALGSAALLDAGTDPGDLVQLNASGQLPAVSGALLTGLAAAQISGLSSGVPTGAILEVGVASAPEGFLACNGAAISRTTYSALFAAIGTTFGAGDGSTTFSLPSIQVAQTKVESSLGTNTGDLIGGAGLSAAFNGVTSSTMLQSAYSTPKVSTVTVGKQYPYLKRITGMRAYAATDYYGFTQSSSSVVLTIQAYVSGAWVDVWASSSFTAAASMIQTQLTGFDYRVSDQWRLVMTTADLAGHAVAELELYESPLLNCFIKY